MKQNPNNFNTKEKIISAESLLKRLKKAGSMFDLSNAEFNLSDNILAIIKNEAVDGIEVISATHEDHQREQLTANISPGLHCSYLRFKKPVNFTGSVFPGPVIFRNVVFENGLYFQRNRLDMYTTFEQVEILHNAMLTANLAQGRFSMAECQVPLQKPGFKYSQFNDDTMFVNCDWPLGLDLTTCRFQKGLQIRHNKISRRLDLSDSNIIGSLVISGSPDGTTKQQIDELQFHDLVLKGQFQLRSNTIHQSLNGARAKFTSSVYINFVEFCGAKNAFAANTFEQVLEITDCRIEQMLSFSYSSFNANILFRNNAFDQADIYYTGCHFHGSFFIGQHHLREAITLNGKLSFLNSTIGSDSIVGIFGINTESQGEGELIFDNALIKGLLDIRSVFVKHITFDGTVVSGNVQENGSIASAVKDRATARLLKNEARKINNQISSLVYYKKEVQAHAKLLKWRQFDDRLMLWLNGISNNYGTSWGRGLVFTLTMTILFYSCFYAVCNGFSGFGDSNSFYAGFINYFWLPSGLEGLIDNHNNIHGSWPGAIFFILGKVLIAYGIYQTVSAFRKYL